MTAVMPSAIIALRSCRVVFEMVVVARIYVKTFSFDRFAVFVGRVNGGLLYQLSYAPAVDSPLKT